MYDHEISVQSYDSDGLRKTKIKAKLAECAGLICRKMGHPDQAIEFLETSILLYPHAEAYLSLAMAWQCRLLQGIASDSERAKNPTERYWNPRQHVQELDVRDEYGHDLEEFKDRTKRSPQGQLQEEPTATD